GGCLLRGSWFDGGRLGRGFLRRLLRSRPGRGLGRFADRLGGLFATLPAGAGRGGSAHQDTSSRARRWSWTTGPSSVTSPAPTGRITSPGRALSATARAATWASGTYCACGMRPASNSEVTPGRGHSLAQLQAVTTTLTAT